MKPFYFGRSEKSLFGVYHPPLNDRRADCGVVLCCPLGHEYVYGHRAVRQLAIQLARAGFAALRFDYYGCGDSAGDAEEGSVARWVDDVETALEEMRSSGKVSKLYLIGARMGATLSALVGSRRSDLEGLVLWDPVVNGKNYVEELIARHQEWLDGSSLRGELPKPGDQNFEALGFPLSRALREGIERIDLLSTRRRPARHVLVVDSDEKSQALQLSNHLGDGNGHSEYRHVPAPRVWLRRGRGENALVPVEVLRSIVSWISRIAT